MSQIVSENNARKALDIFRQSAELGNLEAIKNIAVIFKNGLGQPVDLVNALNQKKRQVRRSSERI